MVNMETGSGSETGSKLGTGSQHNRGTELDGNGIETENGKWGRDRKKLPNTAQAKLRSIASFYSQLQ